MPNNVTISENLYNFSDYNYTISGISYAISGIVKRHVKLISTTR